MILWNYIVIGLGLVLLVLLLWREAARKGRPRLAARMAATILAVGALVCMGLPISCRKGLAGGMGKEGVLLTEGYDKDSVGAFLAEHKGVKIIAADDVRMDRWHVFGYGLTGDEWKRSSAPELVFHPSGVGRGVVAVDWPRRLTKGQRLRVQGQWRGKGKLLLEGMGEVLDSVTVSRDTLFELGTVPAQAGRAMYRLVAVEGRDTLEKEDIPVQVEAGKPLKILLLASSPGAENTFLVNWLVRGGHVVSSRTLVSKDKYEMGYVNGAGPANVGMAAGFDLVIADALALSKEGLMAMLKKQVEEKGLGLVIRVDSAGGVALAKERAGKRVILRDSMGKVEAASSRVGAGKIVYTNYTSYPLVLAGEQGRYAAYWSSLLGETARDIGPGAGWEWQPELPRVGEPVQLLLKAGDAGMPQGVIGTRPVTVYLAEDGVLPYEWRGLYWPEAAGWQTAATLQGDTSWWYTWKGDAWNSLYREKRRRETAGFIRGNRGIARGVTNEREEKEEMPKGWWYALFFVPLVFLWIEKKIL